MMSERTRPGRHTHSPSSSTWVPRCAQFVRLSTPIDSARCTSRKLMKLPLVKCRSRSRLQTLEGPDRFFTDAGFPPDGTFVSWPAHDTDRFTEAFRRAVLRLFIPVERFDEERWGATAGGAQLRGRHECTDLRLRPRSHWRRDRYYNAARPIGPPAERMWKPLFRTDLCPYMQHCMDVAPGIALTSCWATPGGSAIFRIPQTPETRSGECERHGWHCSRWRCSRCRCS